VKSPLPEQKYSTWEAECREVVKLHKNELFTFMYNHVFIISTYDFIASVYIASLPCIGNSCNCVLCTIWQLWTLDSIRFSRRKY